jgi:hypothetical protein
MRRVVPGSWFWVLVVGWTRINSPFEGGRGDVHGKDSQQEFPSLEGPDSYQEGVG